MDLEKFSVYVIDAPLDNLKRKVLEAEMDRAGVEFEKKVTYKWLKRGEEKFLRVFVDPITVEVVFFDDRVELYGAAPAWARLLMTNARKAEFAARFESALVAAGFLAAAPADPQR
ncbi:hypothetical protein GJ654_15735 [Rhodoblastus acidophilus]|uniref:Uncharacterized protein n=1 Tax=Rhodoblastus acidophilus TaxID=1074 RepID=A0A6N8DQ64_RHOAC|nr:hypothetical protein [Rhodoblastus acidophilus]MCW2275835.1 hypothetical protein [Rhodoblastus acidophilus]MTV32438.1 hypothetical protein [Rhodoblastus acidophilus]